MKLPKFMIAKNPMVDTKGVFIVHTRKPEMLLRIVDKGFLSTREHVEIMHAKYEPYQITINNEFFVIYVERFYESYAENDLKQNHEVTQIIKRLKDWHIAVLNHRNQTK